MKTKKVKSIILLAFIIFVTGLFTPMEKSQASQKLSSMYERLGKAYYMQEMEHKDEKMLIKMLMKQIEEANAEFSEAKKKLNESMAKKCEKCGYKNPSNSNFCLNCGSKIEKE